MKRATQRGIKRRLQLSAPLFDAFTFVGSGARAVEQAIVCAIGRKAVNRAAYEVFTTTRGAFTRVCHPDRRIHLCAQSAEDTLTQIQGRRTPLVGVGEGDGASGADRRGRTGNFPPWKVNCGPSARVF